MTQGSAMTPTAASLAQWAAGKPKRKAGKTIPPSRQEVIRKEALEMIRTKKEITEDAEKALRAALDAFVARVAPSKADTAA